MPKLSTISDPVVVWGNNDLLARHSSALKKSPKVILDNYSTDQKVLSPLDYSPQENDRLIIFSLSSYGTIYQQAVTMGFNPELISSIADYIDELPRLEWITSVEQLRQSPLVISRISGEVVIETGLLVITNQLRPVIEVETKTSLVIDNFCVYENPDLLIKGTGIVKLGKNSTLHKNSTLMCKESIIIGDDCALSWDVTLMDHDGEYSLNYPSKKAAQRAGIVIEDNVWVGHHVSILKNVTIGQGSVIAAQSLVNANIPQGTLFGGVPAKLLRNHIKWN